MRHLRHVRPVLLSVLIVVGLIVHSKSVHARSLDTLVVAGGCFWCVEADFEQVEGVREAVSGYTGGTVPDPTYKQVVRGGTGHYEAVQILFDPSVVSMDQLLTLFFRSVDPTDPGGQFCDRGDSYRTAIFVDTPADRASAETAKRSAEAELGQAVVTPILDLDAFYQAEEYHQDYFKSDDLVLTRFGPRSKASAYKLYRNACGRDDRVRKLWGPDAPFVGG